MTAKFYRNRREINLFGEKEENHKSGTGDDMNPDQAKDKYLLQILVEMREKLHMTKEERLRIADSKTIIE